MEFTVGALNVSVSRRAGIGTDLNLSDVRTLNEAHASYVSGLDENELQRRVENVTVDAGGGGYRKAQQVLGQSGIVIIPEFVTPSWCGEFADTMQRLHEQYASRQEDLFEDENALFQLGSSKLKGYGQLSGYGKTVINVRQGQDAGMVDIFNANLILPSNGHDIKKVFEDPQLLGILGQRSLKPSNMNVYMNRGITSTRGFHVDTYAQQIKAFIYLTDVTELDDGPYTFVQGSHEESAFRRANRAVSRTLKPNTEAPVLDQQQITPVLARKGSLVISDQAGIHRGWPQGNDRERMVAVMNYR